ncbi:Tricarboxylate/iron carrier [Cladochytrium replicatum]|nr:Tricarboxylate/iron carrier [Cladochytrium replicatum]
MGDGDEKLVVDIAKPRYDQSTYWGRLKHFSEVTDPRNLIATERQLQDAKALVEDYTAGRVALKTSEEERLWRAKKLVDSTFHPDTGEKIVFPFRMACFVPTNVLIVAGMLQPNPSIAGIVLWQWINQSVNVAFNYFNANKTTKMDYTETATAYGTAVASSCTIAVGLNEWLKRSSGKINPSTFALLSRAVPFTAVAAAGTLNVFLMRQKELKDGIDVFGPDGVVYGKSQTAGMTAISQVAISRVTTAFPAVFLPGIIMTQLERTAWMQRNPRLGIPINLLTIAGSLMAALPCSVALFPQKASASVSKLEPRFQGLVDKDGKKVETLFFNRGL